VNGQDWWPHRHELPTFVGGLTSVLLRDASAAAMERRGARMAEKNCYARFEDGRAFDAREINYPNVEEELMARYVELYTSRTGFWATAPVRSRRKLFSRPSAATPDF